jgi:hypothetical protein
MVNLKDINLKDINFPILTDYEINSTPFDNIILTKPVLCFNNFNNWVMIDINQMLKTPLISTQIYYENEIKNATIVLCPYTLRAVMFEGNLKSSYYDDDRLILKNEENTLIPIDINISIDMENNFEITKRYSVIIQTIRNALVAYSEIQYLHPKNSNKYVINESYLSNNLDENNKDIIIYNKIHFHPKTLVYIIQYNTKKNKIKNTIIIGKNSDIIFNNGYDNKKSGIDKYIEKYSNEIQKRECFIMQMLYFKAIKIYNKSKIIIL